MGFTKFLVVIASFSLVAVVHSGKFPSEEIEQCTAGDSDCLARVVNYVLLNKNQGLRPIGLVPIEPLIIDKLDIVQGGQSPVNIVLNFRNIALTGVSNGKIKSVKGFDPDFDGKKMEIKAKFDGSVTLAGNYKISGRVLILPIQGNGKCNLTLNNFDFTIKFLPKAVEKNGKIHMQVNKAKASITNVGRLYLYFGDLFNGDKALGDNMNLFLNDNWQEIFNELRVSVEGAFANIFKNLVNQVFMTLPYKELFIH